MTSPINTKVQQLPELVVTATNKKGNFFFDPFYPEVIEELNRRKSSANLARTYMPFARLTTSIELPDNKGRFFTVGLHGFDNSEIESIYEPVDGGTLLGYTYKNEKKIPLYTSDIPALVSSNSDGTIPSGADTAGREFLETENIIQREVKKFPPPGITNVKIRRAGIAGSLLQADVEIAVNTLGQLQALQEYLFIPGVNIILEWGRVASGDDPNSLLNSALNFNKGADIEFLKSLVANKKNRRHVFQNYVKHTNCNYDFMVGKVSNFSFAMKGSKYITTVRISSTGDLISSLANTETSLPPTEDGKGDVYLTAINEYFTEQNFELKLQQDEQDSRFKRHVYLLKAPSKTAEATNQAIKEAVAGDQPAGDIFGTNVGGFYISWAYFVNEILHGTTDAGGSLKEHIVQRGRCDTWYNYPQLEKIVAADKNQIAWVDGPVDDPDEKPIGCHLFLRSIDPSVMVIFNQTRQTNLPYDTFEQALTTEVKRCINRNPGATTGDDMKRAYETFKSYGHFEDALGNFGKLSRGVWINHHVISRAFINNPTFHAALSQILRAMSAATGNFWNLQLHLNEASSKLNMEKPEIKVYGPPTLPAISEGVNSSDDASTTFTIIDVHTTDSLAAAKELIETAKRNKIYMFNRRLNSNDINKTDYTVSEGTSLGSGGGELISLEADFSLPSILASQIAVQGIRGPGDSGYFGIIGSSTGFQTGAMFETTIIDILKPPTTQTAQRDGMNEEDAYSVPIGAAGRIIRLHAAGKGGEDVKINEIKISIGGNKKTGLKPLEYTLGMDVLIAMAVAKSTGNTVLIDRLNEFALNQNKYDNIPNGEYTRRVKLQALFKTTLAGAVGLSSTVGDEATNGVISELGYDKSISSNMRAKLSEALTPPGALDNRPPVAMQALLLTLLQTNNAAFEKTVNEALDNLEKNKTDSTNPVTAFTRLLHIAAAKYNTAADGRPNDMVESIFTTNTPLIQREILDSQKADAQLGAIIERYKNYGTFIEFIELIPSYMSRRARSWALADAKLRDKRVGTNLLSPAPTRLHIKISLPGISSIHIGDLFWVDRIQPNLYLDGLFTTIGLSESITPSKGWVTSIEGVFLFLGRFHFAEVFQGIQPSPDSITRPIGE